MTDILSLKEELRILNTRLLFANGGDTLDKGGTCRVGEEGTEAR